MSTGSRSEWPGPAAKLIAALVLGAGAAAGIGYSVVRESTPWRAHPEPRASPGSGATAHEPGSEARARTPAALVKQAAPAVRININTASKAELELLPGIGPALADRIIAERQRGGGFGRVEDLSRVKGIGDRTIDRLRAHVTCGTE